MADEHLRTLLDRNQSHTSELPADYFAEVRDAQRPPVVSLCCSDSRVSQEGMWDVDEPGWLFTPSNIGNQAWDAYEEDLVLEGSVAYPIVHTDTGVAAVVGHTGCGAVTAAYEYVTEDAAIEQPGIRERIELLVPVIEDALDDDVVDADASRETVITQLVEYNVHRQVAFLCDHDDVPDDVDAYGFVYDLHEKFGDVPGRTYVVDVNGTTDPGAIADSLSQEYASYVESALY